MKTNLKTIMILMIFTLVSCKKKEEYKAIFYSSESEKIESEISFYKFKNGFYVHIENQNKRENISQLILDSIVLKIDGKLYKAKPTNLYYSRKIPETDFIFPVLNKNHKIEIVNIDNKDMFTLGSVKTNLFNLKEENKILFTEVYEN